MADVLLYQVFNPADQTHNFLLFRGGTADGSTAGAWCNYQKPDGDNPGIVQMMYATRESRIYAPLLLGVLGKHSQDTYGELPVGSHNLSCHSFPIQKRLATILGQLPATSPINYEDWFKSLAYIRKWAISCYTNFDYYTNFNELYIEELTLQDLEEGKRFLLDILHGKGNNLQPAFFDREYSFSAQRRKNNIKLSKYEEKYTTNKRRNKWIKK